MSEIYYLSQELKDNTLDWAPSKHLTWMLVVQLESCVPRVLFKKNMKGYVKKACRLFFASHVVGRNISSFKQLKPGEVVRIKRWLEGNGPSPSDDKMEDDRVLDEIVRIDELEKFWTEHKSEIYNLAHWLKVKK